MASGWGSLRISGGGHYARPEGRGQQSKSVLLSLLGHIVDRVPW